MAQMKSIWADMSWENDSVETRDKDWLAHSSVI
jgi:hypothetical protein